MCFAIPKQIKKVTNSSAITEDNMTINTGTLDVATGDYVLVYGNMAVDKIDKNQALKTRQTISKIDNS